MFIFCATFFSTRLFNISNYNLDSVLYKSVELSHCNQLDIVAAGSRGMIDDSEMLDPHS